MRILGRLRGRSSSRCSRCGSRCSSRPRCPPTPRSSAARPTSSCVVVVSLALLRGPEIGALAGFGAGLAVDALTWQPLGLAALVYCVVGYGAGRVGERVSDHAPVSPLVVVAIASLVARAGLVLLELPARLGARGAGRASRSVRCRPRRSTCCSRSRCTRCCAAACAVRHRLRPAPAHVRARPLERV